MAGIVVGSVSVEVVPSARGFRQKLAAQLKDVSLKVNVEADTTKARTEIDAATRNRRATVKVNADTSDFEKKMLRLQGKLGGISPLAAFAPAGIAALTPVAVAATAGVAGLGAAMSLAAIGAGSFALVAVPAFSKVADASKELAKAQNAVTAATTSKQRQSALAKEAALWKSLTGPQQAAVRALQTFEGTWKSFQAGFQPALFGIFAQGLSLGVDALNNLKPIITQTLPYVSALLDVVKQSDPFWRAWADSISGYTGPALSLFGQSILNISKGIASLISAFAPLGLTIGQSLTDMTAKFAAWAANFGPSGGLQRFLDYVHQNGPAVRDLLTQFGTALHTLGGALLTAGPGFLGAAVNLLKLFNTLTAGHPALASFLLEGAAVVLLAAKLAGAFRAFTVLSAVPGLIGGVSGAVKTLGFNMQVAGAIGVGGPASGLLGGLGKVTSFLGGPWGIAIGAAAALIGGAFIAKHEAAKRAVDDLAGSLDKETQALTNESKAQIAHALQDSGAYKAAKLLGISIRDVTLAAEGNQAALGRVNKQLDNLPPSGRKGADAANTLRVALGGANDQLESARKKSAAAKAKLDELNVALGKGVAPAHALTTATGGAAESANGAAQAYQRMHDKVDALRGLSVNIPIFVAGERAAEEALARVADAAQAAALRGVNISVTAGSHHQQIHPGATGGLIAGGALHRGFGGPVWGAGTATSDSIPAYLSNGEFVQQASAVAKYGVKFMRAVNNGTLGVGGGTALNVYVSGALDPTAVAAQIQTLLLKRKQISGQALGLA